jgi:hypothetical protein
MHQPMGSSFSCITGAPASTKPLGVLSGAVPAILALHAGGGPDVEVHPEATMTSQPFIAFPSASDSPPAWNVQHEPG